MVQIVAVRVHCTAVSTGRAGASRKPGLRSGAWRRPLECLLSLRLRNCLVAPFHNMMLVCPATTELQVERLRQAFADVAAQLTQR
jgi:hypothetical protein